MICVGTLRINSLRLAHSLGASRTKPDVPYFRIALPDGLVLFWPVDPLAFVERAA